MRTKRLVVLLTAVATLWFVASGRVAVRSRFQAAPHAGGARSFAEEVARLSEPAGDFDTDNLISNERSYLEVVPALERAGVSGGAYVGVGPDQNFSYIASVRPAVAFILDVRRDNLLLHLLFKALFNVTKTRVEYLCALTGRAPPTPIDPWRDATVQRMVSYVDDAPSLPPDAARQLSARLDAMIKGFGVPLEADDLDTIHRFHAVFSRAGLSLQFQSRGRPPRSYYPTYRELMLGTDPDGRERNFLAAERSFEFVRSLQVHDLIIPVVGNLGGRHALGAIGMAIRERGTRLSALYASNVEDYLFRDGAFPTFIDNLQRLPHDDTSVIVRSVFGGYGGSRSEIQSVSQLLAGWSAGKFHTYWELVR